MKTKKYVGVLFVLLVCLFSTNAVQAANNPYELEVNLTKNVVTVYGKGNDGKYTVPKKAFVCSTGKSTPTGTFRTSDKYQWREMYGGVYAQYATRITGHILFHSVTYEENQKKNTLDYNAYNQLGATVSMGCVRLTVEDAKWIYDNCPSGTTVRIVRQDTVSLVPTAPKKIDPQDRTKRGWDPTDPDVNNPWKPKQEEKPTPSSAKPKLIPSVDKKEVIDIESDTYVGTVEMIRAEGRFYMRAEDVKLIWGEAGEKLTLPKVLPYQDWDKGTVEISYAGKAAPVAYYICEGIPYYKMRDLANLSAYALAWSEKNQKISLFAPTK